MAYQKYKTSSVQSASKEKLLLMLYEGAMKFIKRAIIACENKDISERGLNIGRAYDIIVELNNTLDHKVGGELALNLEQLYMFLTDQLTKANVSGNSESLHVALRITQTLYDGWVKAIEIVKKGEKSGGNLK